MKNKVYSFSTDDAIAHGVDEAILLHNIRYWLDYARAHDEMKQDGYHWMYMTATSMQLIMPFWSVNKIRKMLKSLEKDGIVITGEYNKSSWNRTKWYSMPEFYHVANPPHATSQTATSTCSQTATSLYSNKEDSNIIDYSAVEDVYNRCLPLASNLSKLTATRKAKVKKFFDEFNMDLVRFENYLLYISETKDFSWMFEKRPMNDGTGRFWQKQKFEYFISEKCYLMIKESMDD